MRIIKLYIVILFLLMGSFAIAVNNVYEHDENHAFKFVYTLNHHNEYSVNDFFIREIARYNLSGLYNTSFTFHYSVHKRIQKVSPNTFNVFAQLVGEKCTGDIYYKDFDISDILMPEKADFNIIVIDSGNYFYSREFKEIEFDKSNTFSTEFSFETLKENKNYTLSIEDIIFYSDNNDREAFFKRIHTIDNYYASIDAIDYAIDKFTEIELTPNSIIETYLKIKELERIYNKISQAGFATELNLKKNDIAGFYEKLTKFKREITRYNSYFNILLSSIDFLKLDNNIANCAENYVNEVASYYLLSQQVSHSHSYYFYSLSEINYTLSFINRYFNGLEDIIVKSGYCYDTRKILTDIKNEVFIAYLNKASEFIDSEQYYLAKGLLLNAQSFFDATVNGSNPVELNILISKANYGIYDSYLHLIDRAIDVGNYKLAENYINKAQSFQQENSVSIISNRHIERISGKLVQLYISKGYRLLEEDEFKDAIYCFSEAHMICNEINQYNYDYEIKHGLIHARNGLYNNLITRAGLYLKSENISTAKTCMDNVNALLSKYPSKIIISREAEKISSEINYHTYKDLNAEGRILLESGNYTLAYQKFLKAFELEEVSDFDFDDDLPLLFQHAASPVLVDLCSLGEVKVKKNQLDEARKIYENCFSLQDEYGLIFEPNVQQSLTLLNNSIFNKHCENSVIEFNEIISAFNNSVDQGDFISAIEILDQTNNVFSKNYYCEFDRELVVEMRRKYTPASDYQKLARIARDALVSEDHQKFIETHQKMEELSSNYEVIRKYIEPMPLHYLFSAKKNLAFLESSINYYKSEDEIDMALKLLRVLEANNFSNKETKSIQQKLAYKMAKTDKANARSEDPKINVEKYTEGKSYYKHFKKTYIKNW